MFGKKIKVSNELYEKIELAAKISGAATVEEFGQRVLEREVDKLLTQSGKKELSASEVEDIASKLKGLGYLE